MRFGHTPDCGSTKWIITAQCPSADGSPSRPTLQLLFSAAAAADADEGEDEDGALQEIKAMSPFHPPPRHHTTPIFSPIPDQGHTHHGFTALSLLQVMQESYRLLCETDRVRRRGVGEVGGRRGWSVYH